LPTFTKKKSLSRARTLNLNREVDASSRSCHQTISVTAHLLNSFRLKVEEIGQEENKKEFEDGKKASHYNSRILLSPEFVEMEYQHWLRLEKENANLLQKEFLNEHILDFGDEDELFLKHQRGENLSEVEFLKVLKSVLVSEDERSKNSMLLDLKTEIPPFGFIAPSCKYWASR
jgi:hypothetical protein